jgi:hypothetical protein
MNSSGNQERGEEKTDPHQPRRKPSAIRHGFPLCRPLLVPSRGVMIGGAIGDVMIGSAIIRDVLIRNGTIDVSAC